jgi:CBS domain-containing protein
MTGAIPSPVAPGDFLRAHAPFDRLPPDLFAEVEAALEIRFAAAGERILERGGAPSDALWIVRKGRVRLEREAEVLEVLEPGECFGFPSLLGRRTPVRDAIAVEDCLLLRLPEARFRRLLDDPGAARFFLDSLAARLRVIGSGPRVAEPVARLPGRRPLAVIGPAATAAEAAARMRDAGVGSLLVTREERGPATELPLAAIAGIVTDRDLRDRVLAAGRPATMPVVDILSSPLRTLDAGATATDALLELARHGIRHLPLVDGDRVVGFVSAGDLVQERTLHPLALRRELERGELSDLLPGWTGRLRRTVADLAASGVDAASIGPIVATLTDRLARRLVDAASRDLLPAGAELAWIVHGSEGRQEQILPTDQDNALIWRSAPGSDGVPGAITRIVERIVGDLLAAGYPECPGGYMATRWHEPLELWIRRFERWIAEPREEIRVDLSTFLDLRPVAGTLDLAPLAELRAAAGRDRHLLRALAQEIAAWPLPLGLFGALREREHGFDLKRGSLLIVAVARLAALEAGSAAHSTLDRLRVAEPILGEDAATLAEGFRFLANLRLELALDPSRRAENGSGHRIHLARLNALERRILKDIFALLRELRGGLAARFAL